MTFSRCPSTLMIALTAVFITATGHSQTRTTAAKSFVDYRSDTLQANVFVIGKIAISSSTGMTGLATITDGKKQRTIKIGQTIPFAQDYILTKIENGSVFAKRVGSASSFPLAQYSPNLRSTFPVARDPWSDQPNRQFAPPPPPAPVRPTASQPAAPRRQLDAPVAARPRTYQPGLPYQQVSEGFEDESTDDSAWDDDSFYDSRVERNFNDQENSEDNIDSEAFWHRLDEAKKLREID